MSMKTQTRVQVIDDVDVDVESTRSDTRLGFYEEKTREGRRTRRRKLRVIKSVEVGLGCVLVIWAVYSTTRYSISYTIYTSHIAQTISLVLATSTSASLGMFFTQFLVGVSQGQLVSAGIPLQMVLVTNSVLRSAGAFFLLAPAIVNLVMTVVGAVELDVGRRCSLDVDIVWNTRMCEAGTQKESVWIGLAVLRLGLTILILMLYILTSTIYVRTRYSHSRRRREEKRTSLVPAEALERPLRSYSRSSLNRSIQSESLWLTRQVSMSHLSTSAVNPSSSEEPEPEQDPAGSRSGRIGASSAPPTQADFEGLADFAERFKESVTRVREDVEQGLDRDREPRPDVSTPSTDGRQSALGYGYAYDESGRVVVVVTRSRHEAEDAAGLDPSTYVYAYVDSEGQLSDEDEFSGEGAEGLLRSPPPSPTPTSASSEHILFLNSYIRRMPTILSVGSGNERAAEVMSARSVGTTWSSAEGVSQRSSLSQSPSPVSLCALSSESSSQSVSASASPSPSPSVSPSPSSSPSPSLSLSLSLSRPGSAGSGWVLVDVDSQALSRAGSLGRRPSGRGRGAKCKDKGKGKGKEREDKHGHGLGVSVASVSVHSLQSTNTNTSQRSRSRSRSRDSCGSRDERESGYPQPIVSSQTPTQTRTRERERKSGRARTRTRSMSLGMGMSLVGAVASVSGSTSASPSISPSVSRSASGSGGSGSECGCGGDLDVDGVMRMRTGSGSSESGGVVVM